VTSIVPMGVVLCVDGDYYVALFKPMDPVTVTAGMGVELTLDPLRVMPWAGPAASGLVPLRGMRDVPNPLRTLEPRPPEFSSVEEAEEWLAKHPALLDTNE